jgi:hypothetical protein
MYTGTCVPRYVLAHTRVGIICNILKEKSGQSKFVQFLREFLNRDGHTDHAHQKKREKSSN